MFKLPIPTRLTDYLGEAVVWTVISYVKIDRKLNYRVPRETADICKTIKGRGLEVVLMERTVNFTSYDIS